MATMLRTADRTWSGLISDLLRGRDLTAEETWWAMDRVVGGDATSAQVSGFLIALRAKGETPAEIAAMAAGLRRHATGITIPGPFVDIVGTGGDGTGAVNISTMAAIVAASTGLTVVKHGGRAASSQTGGSADLVEYLGVPLDLSPADAVRVAEKAGITYLFAPRFNPGLRHVAAVRRELGVPTAFNVLGPLINPADPQHQLVGVADARMQPVIAAVLASRGSAALVVRGDDGLDKLTTTGGARRRSTVVGLLQHWHGGSPHRACPGRGRGRLRCVGRTAAGRAARALLPHARFGPRCRGLRAGDVATGVEQPGAVRR